MGLGLLLCGYLFCLNLLNVYFLPFASALMFWALKKLSFINAPLNKAKYVLIPLFFVGSAGILLALVNSFIIKLSFYDIASCLLSCMSHLGLLIFMYMLLTGIRQLTDEVKLTSLSIKAVRNRLFCFFYYVPAFLLELPIWKPTLFFRTASFFTIILGIVVFFLNVYLLNSCFRKICMPEDATR